MDTLQCNMGAMQYSIDTLQYSTVHSASNPPNMDLYPIILDLTCIQSNRIQSNAIKFKIKDRRSLLL